METRLDMCTSEALALQLAMELAPRLGRARLPAYGSPEWRVKPEPSASPEFLEFMRRACSRFTFHGCAGTPPEVVQVLRYHRMYGFRELFKKSITGVDLMSGRDWRLHKGEDLLKALTTLVGDLLLGSMTEEEYDTWFPWNNFEVRLSGDRDFAIACESLEAHSGTDGEPFYAAQEKPTVRVERVRRQVGFAPHALKRLNERGTATHSYASLGDAFGMVAESHFYQGVTLHPQQPAIALFDHCVEGYFSYAYALEILGELDPEKNYVYRVGYAPVAANGAFWVAKTVLSPGFGGTPEYGAVLGTSFDPGVKEGLLQRCTEQGYARLCQARDFGLLRWFHRHGVPQVMRLDGSRLINP